MTPNQYRQRSGREGRDPFRASLVFDPMRTTRFTAGLNGLNSLWNCDLTYGQQLV
jgi:hypothetical protein